MLNKERKTEGRGEREKKTGIGKVSLLIICFFLSYLPLSYESSEHD